MKKLSLIITLILLGCMNSAKAQDFSHPRYARYGETNEERKENITLYNYFDASYKTKDYDDALKYMHKLIENCPAVSMNLYINGGDIYRMKMARAMTKAEKTKYLDSMMYLMDLRIEHFADHKTHGKHYSLAQKAIIYNQNNPTDTEKGFALYRNAIETSQHLVDPSMCRAFFNTLTEAYKLDDITPEEYLEDYEAIIFALEGGEKTTENEQAVSYIEGLFASSGAASCENIENIFRPKYEADPENSALVKKILNLYNRNKCSSDFQLALTEKFYNLEPSPELAVMLANIYSEKQEHQKALGFYDSAIEAETDPTKKMNYLTLATSSALSAHQYSTAAKYARNMIALDDNNGYGHLFLANAYAGGANGCSDFSKKAAYWLVVDTFVRARARFEGNEQQIRNINSNINAYSAHFPNSEETFMRGLSKGDGYNVNCGWLSGRTTVR